MRRSVSFGAVKAILRSTTILGAASLVPIGVGLVAAKAWAHLIGPSGYGLLGLLQSLVAIAGLLADVGLSTTLVRVGAMEANQDSSGSSKLWRAGVLAAIPPALLTVFAMVLFRKPLAASVLGGVEHSPQVIFCGIALLGSISGGLATAMLNAHRRVGALARVGVWGAILPTATALGTVMVWGVPGIAAGFALGAIVRTALAAWLLWKELGLLPWSGGRSGHVVLARALLAQGVPLLLSQACSAGVHLAVPILVLHLLGVPAVGFYQAAYAIAVGALGFLLTAFGQDYLPRVAAVANQPQALSSVANEQHKLVMLIGFPLILVVKAAAPLLIPLLYSSDFSHAKDILVWLLVADVLKFSSWTLSYLILARCSGPTFFFMELLAGASLVAGISLGSKAAGAAGVGIGFLFSYVVYWLATWRIARTKLGFAWDRANLLVLLATLIGATLPQVIGYFCGRFAELFVAAGVAAAASALALRGVVRIIRSKVVSDMPESSNSG